MHGSMEINIHYLSFFLMRPKGECDDSFEYIVSVCYGVTVSRADMDVPAV